MRVRFDKELEFLNIDLTRMAVMAGEAIEQAIIALQNHDAEPAKLCIQNDKEIDNIERQIETRALRLLLQQQPVAKDLRAISTALKLITDLERIGDQAADIAEISMRFSGKTFSKEPTHILEMASITIDMVKKSIEAFVKSDLELAKQTISMDDLVDNLFIQVKEDLIKLLSSSLEDTDQVIDLLMIAKYLERIGDHAENVAEWVIFSLTGQHKDTKII